VVLDVPSQSARRLSGVEEDCAEDVEDSLAVAEVFFQSFMWEELSVRAIFVPADYAILAVLSDELVKVLERKLVIELRHLHATTTVAHQ